MKFYTRVHALLNSLRSADDGATAVEYGLMVSLIAVVVIAVITTIGVNLDTIFKFVGGKLVVPT